MLPKPSLTTKSNHCSSFTLELSLFPPFFNHDFILFGINWTPDSDVLYSVPLLVFCIQDTTDNNTSVCIILFRNLSKPNFFRPVKESWIRIISYLFPMWVNLILCILCLTRYFFINRFSGLRTVRVNVKLPSKYIPLLDGLYTPFSDEKKSSFCMTSVLVSYVINWQVLGFREVYITTSHIVHVLIIITFN